MAENPVLIDDILVTIFGYLNARDLTKISLICKQWYRVSKSRELWRRLVLQKWPSQRFLYKNMNTGSLHWQNAFIELTQKSWFSADNMKYFISCKTVEDELVSPELRQAMFEKMSIVSQKWLQVYPFELDDTNQDSFDKNAELYYDTSQLKWVFLDRRRGYMRDLFPSHKLKSINRSKKERHIRTYQVIPSCLVLYRWLCLFKSYATAEDGLTFYRIWKFRLRHLETGKIFEIYDWKAAMNSTFSKGKPRDSVYRGDALELLNLLTHPNFIMHPLGLHPDVPNANRYLASASAGGMPRPQLQTQKREKRKRKIRQSVILPAQDRVRSPTHLFDQAEATQIDSRAIRRIQCTVNPLISPIPKKGSSQSQAFTFDGQSYSRQSSAGSIFSDTEDSERSEKESDVESECETSDTGYVSNCEYFIVSTHSFDIEEQHSTQASISDGWMVTRKPAQNTAPVLFNNIEGSWYFPNDRNETDVGVVLNVPNLPMKFSHSRSSSDVSMQSEPNLDISDDNLPVKKSFAYHADFPSNLKDTPHKTTLKLGDATPTQGCSTFSVTDTPQASASNGRLSSKPLLSISHPSEFESNYESIPSCLAVYRLICLFDLNCSMYSSSDDVSVWCVKMLHKKTGGVMQFQDYNGWFQVHVSTMATLAESGGESADEEEGAATTTTDSSITTRDSAFDVAEFKAAVLQVLGLLMDDNFSHPYGTVAGSVA